MWSYICGKPRCKTCLNVQEVGTFRSLIDGRQYRINHRLDCDDRSLVYLLSCKICSRQYVSQTTDKFRFRRNNYKACQRKAVRGEEHQQNYFRQHFLTEDHNGLIEDCEICLIDKTDSSDPTRRESFRIARVRNLSPEGFRIQENIWLYFFL